MPDTYSVEPRVVIGKAVSRLRRDGIIPANIYGRGVESRAVQLALPELRTMMQAHGRNVLINLQVSGEDRPRPVVVRDIGREPASGRVQHVDFYQVDLSRPIQADVPVVLVGEAPAVFSEGGVLMQGVETVSIEALPSDLPEHLEVSVDGLAELDSQVTVGDIRAISGVTILADPDIMVARVARPRVAEEAEVLEGEEALPAGVEIPAAGEGAGEASDAGESAEG